MDHHNLIRNIFSRNTSPPLANSFAPSNTLQSYPEEQSPSVQHFQQFQHVSPAQSLKDVPPSSPPAQVDSFLSNLTAPGQSSVNPNPQFQGTAQPPATTTTSGPTSPASSFTALSAPTMSKSTNTPPNPNVPGDSRQSTLLSLMSSVSPAGSSSSASGAPQQVPTPPGPPNRTGPTATVTAASSALASNTNESQGRLLLEQLMAG